MSRIPGSDVRPTANFRAVLLKMCMSSTGVRKASTHHYANGNQRERELLVDMGPRESEKISPNAGGKLSPTLDIVFPQPSGTTF